MGFEAACHLACNRPCSFLHVDRLPKFNDCRSTRSRLYVGLGVSFGKVAAELLDQHENC
jgi:hypothetical protein